MKADLHWTNEEWLASAKSNLKWLNERASSERKMMFLRHSHREVISDHSAQLSTELTDLGKRMSYELGLRLPLGHPVRIFHSFVTRCFQTAENIARGIRNSGGNVIDLEPLVVIASPDIFDEAVWSNLQPDGKNITDYVNNWADGKFGEMIEDFEHYRTRLLEATLGRLSNASEPEFHIHISHDLSLMALKRIILNRALVDSDRESFLGGVSISFDRNGIRHQSF